ncbi:hypothetical protein NADFUDRAFT_71218 [Nadsonia fulvescens var. elongata DSM 6958]|uniref:Zn(2)-C6 fungal-type domain-containing protein n=1 Tax=Nadsonia fulvescens var. elongata DSM 6958 TaxID=857566 RepID=A0A1E3PHD7_9ASCO|nr:hypothetical protein NADFUDRAFT_71218 [Nadsonia fulvescens var. elongata DSM 6958]
MAESRSAASTPSNGVSQLTKLKQQKQLQKLKQQQQQHSNHHHHNQTHIPPYHSQHDMHDYQDLNESDQTFMDARKHKRVGKACDSCRIKKTKCDGKKPCTKCLLDNKLCTYSEKRKPKEKQYPQGYVDLLESRLAILQKVLQSLVVRASQGHDINMYLTSCLEPASSCSSNSTCDVKNNENNSSPSTIESPIDLVSKQRRQRFTSI